MNALPTRLHHYLALLWFTGMVLFVAAMSLGWHGFASAAGLVFLGAACAFSAADVRYLLTARRGYGRVSGHITEERNPVSFKLHVVLALILSVLWGLAFLLGLQEILR